MAPVWSVDISPRRQSPSHMRFFRSMRSGVYSFIARTLSWFMFGAKSPHRMRKSSMYSTRISAHSSAEKYEAIGKKNQPVAACRPGGACDGSQSVLTHVPAAGSGRWPACASRT